jgi:hypothetical protein
VTPKEILALPLFANDAGAETVRDYLRELLFTLWREGEGFCGKRPFGNSGWERELLSSLPESAVGDRDPIDVIADAIKAL